MNNKNTPGTTALAADINQNLSALKTHMSDSADLVIKLAEAGGQAMALITCEGMVNSGTASTMIFEPLRNLPKDLSPEQLAAEIGAKLLIALDESIIATIDDAAAYAMAGFAVLFIGGVAKGYAIGVQGFSARSVEQALTNLNLRSSRESFNEVIRTNMSLLRRRIKSPALVFNMMKIGEESQTDVCVCYVKGKADPKMVEDILARLRSIKISVVLEGGYLQPFLEDRDHAIFSEIGNTERPDTLAAKLVEGRIGVMVDGTPFVLFLPRLFSENFHTMDDYTGKPLYTSIMRAIKYFAFYMTILLPGFYVAIADFHPELFPSKLLFNLTTSVQGTPFPLMLECIIIHIMYEIMREAGLRLPIYAGHAVSIVGGLVIGQIVVSAGLIGAPLVMIVGIAAINSFVVPEIYDSIVVLRFLFILAGGFWGLFGIIIAGEMLMVKIFSMSVYGVPYTAPLLPFTKSAMRDFVTRQGWRKLSRRDAVITDLYGVNKL